MSEDAVLEERPGQNRRKRDTCSGQRKIFVRQCVRLKRAFDGFFRRVKNGEKPGYPRFQGRNRYISFTYPDGAGWKLEAQKRPAEKKGMVRVDLRLSKIGTVKLHLHRDIVGTIKTLTIKREGEDFYAVFSCEIGKPEALAVGYEDVGIDLGIT